jgi:hypothetical protein
MLERCQVAENHEGNNRQRVSKNARVRELRDVNKTPVRAS